VTTTPAILQRFFDTTNAGDTAGFLACFTADAFLDDWGSQYEGQDGVARWNQTDNIGVGSKLTPMGIAPDGYDWRVTVSVTGRGFNGEGTMRFRVADDRITRLVIS
jgi:hypothetical protein